MIIVNNALKRREAEGKPLRVALVGAGFAARGVTQQLLTPLPGMRLAAIVNRTIEHAAELMIESNANAFEIATTAAQFRAAEQKEQVVVTEDIEFVTQSDRIDVIVERHRASGIWITGRFVSDQRRQVVGDRQRRTGWVARPTFEAKGRRGRCDH